MQPTLFIFLGGVLAALAVGLGALGAHALKSELPPQQLVSFHTAVQYQNVPCHWFSLGWPAEPAPP